MNGGGAVTRFSESAPRPPVFPGEENVLSSQVKMDPWAVRFGRRCPSTHSPSKGSSPILTPRRHGHSIDECDATRRYEAAEGSASTSPPLAETPPYLRWAENLHFLLADPDGVELFEKYLEQENCPHLLKFWFACEGLKRQWTEDPKKAVQITQVIHKKYIRAGKIPVSEVIRKEINDRVTSKSTLDSHIFDDAQKEVEDQIRASVYLNFLSSEIYLSYIQSMQNGLPDSPRSGRSQAGSDNGSRPYAPGEPGVVLCEERPPQFLQTVPEDTVIEGLHEGQIKPVPLTHKALMATKQERLEPRSLGWSYPGRALQNPYHTSYAPYNPVSRQDSEISSDAHTDDTRSLTDSSVDGSMLFFPLKPNKHQLRKEAKFIRRGATQNRDVAASQPFIPRTHRPPPKEQMTPQQPHEFAALLIQKLEMVKRERESEEKLLRIVAERDSEASGIDEPSGPPAGRINRPGSDCSARVLAEALSRIAPSNEADTQSILDNHVQRIWSDQTPLRSPGAPSPRPRSPERRRMPPNLITNPKVMMPPIGATTAYPPNYHQRLPAHPRRKERDIEKGSTYSADSGAVLDLNEGGRELRSYVPKSQSIPDTRRIGLMASSGTGSAIVSKKSDYDRVHDSGLSLHTDPPAATFMAPPPVLPKDKVLHWFSNNEKWQDGGERDQPVKHRSRPQSSTSPNSSRRNRKPVPPYGNSRSESLERAGAGSLTEDEGRRLPTKPKLSVPQVPPMSTSMKKPSSSGCITGEGGSTAPAEFTVVTFTLGDEPVPYRSKIPGRNVTLKQFKELCLPKKGNYKYYFKTNCDDDVALAVNQEVTDDAEILPLWEDKVLGIVKPID